MDLKLLWVGVSRENATALFSEARDKALAHASQGRQNGDPSTDLRYCLCVVDEHNNARVLAELSDSAPIGLPWLVPSLLR